MGKKRKRVLRIAHVAYVNLERAVNNLKRMARNHAKVVSIKVDHANAAKDTKVFVRNVERTVKSLQKKSRAAIARAVARRALRRQLRRPVHKISSAWVTIFQASTVL